MDETMKCPKCGSDMVREGDMMKCTACGHTMSADDMGGEEKM